MSIALAGAAFLTAAATFAERAAADEPPIVLIVIDTLRADHLSCYGYERETSPTIDAIAAHAFLFENAISAAPWTVPSMASLFTSSYPSEHGVLKHTERIQNKRGLRVTNKLGDDWTTLAELLFDGGYATGGFIANPWLSEQFGYGQGFERFNVMRKGGGYHDGSLINERAVGWLNEKKGSGDKLMLYVHYMDVHGPYNAPKKFRSPWEDPLVELLEQDKLTPVPKGFRLTSAARLKDFHPPLKKYQEFYIARYDAGIRFVDEHIRNLRDALIERGLWDEALVIIVADHGQEMCEHGGGGHGHSLFAHQLHVPLIIKLPHQKTGERISATVSLLDVLPTICEVAGLEPPEQIHGKSLLPMLESAAARKDAYAFAEGVRKTLDQIAVRLADRKVIINTTTGEVSYFDLAADPLEQSPSNVAPDELAAQMRDALKRWLRTTRAEKEDAPEVADPAAIDPELSKTLKSLGYLGDDE